MSFAEAAYQILKQVGKPLSADEITSAALEQRMVSTAGKTPSATMGARLYVDIKTKGDNSRFVKVNRGKFGLREWSTSPRTTSDRFPLFTFKDTAYKVLKRENRPMSKEEITDIALRKGLLKTTGKTPTATMGAQLYVDIKMLQNRSTFVQLGKNRFGLREWGLEILKDEIEKAESEKIIPVGERKRSIVGDPINFEGLISFMAPLTRMV